MHAPKLQKPNYARGILKQFDLKMPFQVQFCNSSNDFQHLSIYKYACNLTSSLTLDSRFDKECSFSAQDNRIRISGPEKLPPVQQHISVFTEFVCFLGERDDYLNIFQMAEQFMIESCNCGC